MRLCVERAVDFNNAGVEVLAAGHPRVAWELFKGALEVKLAVERYETEYGPLLTTETTAATQKYNARLQQQQQQLRVEPPIPPYLSNAFVEQAERHLAVVETFLAHPVPQHHVQRRDSIDGLNANGFFVPGIPNQRQHMEQTQADTAAAAMADDSILPTGDFRSHYIPKILTKPLRLEAPPSASRPDLRAARSGRESAVIIFNLALLDHLKYTCSQQARALYELAMSLRTGISDFDPLRISLLNNVGVWSYENGDVDITQSCMCQLATILQRGKTSQAGEGSNHEFRALMAELDPEERESLQSNLLWFMNPFYSASPAA